METFKPSRSLLNPKFEGYKLDPVSQEDTVARFPLQFRPTEATISGNSSFSFQEVQSRITHNHLAVCSNAGRAIYVDFTAKVILIDFDTETLVPSFRVLFELPASLQSNDGPSRNREYPSAAFLSPNLVFVSDGQGLMYALKLEGNNSSKIAAVFSMSEGSTESPFRIHSVHTVTPTTVIAILSSRHYMSNPEPDSHTRGREKPLPTDFDIWGAQIELPAEYSGEIRPVRTIWHRRGQEVPVYTAYSYSLKTFLLVGGTNYLEVGHVPTPSYEPSSDEIAPIPKADEKFDVDAPEPPKPSPYSWTQTSDSLTLAIPLPSNTPKHTIKVTFSSQTLSLHIDSDITTSVPIPRYSAKKLWAVISASTSYWTWDREAEHSFGILTLYLDKQHEGTKWAQVFASTCDEEDVEVLETLDPSELWHIRESLEKYTMALRDGDDASGLGLGRGVPSLAEGEIDMEVDDTVGRTVYLSWVAENGAIPPWWKISEEVPFQLLSTPVPGLPSTDVSLVTKNNLDGTVFTLKTGSKSPVWAHTSTFSALSFVLASKQDTRFTFHTPQAVFAFEGGTRDRGGNVYIYRSASSSDKWAKQSILKVGGGYGGSLLGVGVLQLGGLSGSPSLLLCLTEGELVLIKNINP